MIGWTELTIVLLQWDGQQQSRLETVGLFRCWHLNACDDDVVSPAVTLLAEQLVSFFAPHLSAGSQHEEEEEEEKEEEEEEESPRKRG